MVDHEAAKSSVLIDDEKVRVTEWRFAPGTHTGWHRHALDYLVVPMTTGVLEMTGENEQGSSATLTAGVPYRRDAGVAHDVINANTFEFTFIEVELKQG